MDLVSSQRLASVHPKLSAVVQSVYEGLGSQGMPILVVSGYRSWEQQNELYAEGRTAPGKIVTNARGGQSMHNYGLAVDLQPLKPHGVLDGNIASPAFKAMIKAMKDRGMHWGGDWRSFRDYPHFQLPQFPSPLPSMKQAILQVKSNSELPGFWHSFDSGTFV